MGDPVFFDMVYIVSATKPMHGPFVTFPAAGNRIKVKF